jgi:SAM-dependent methyltransferase
VTEPRPTGGPDADWTDPERVDRWVAKDAGRPAVQAARDVAAAIVALDSEPALVLELAAGAGSFLATFLRTFPAARGIWSDSSEPMVRHARETLAEFPARVDFVVADLRRPAIAGEAAPDVLICSRVTHTLDAAELADLYRHAAGLLVPGGWLVNLDHMTVSPTWDARYGELTPRFYDGIEASRGSAPGKDRGSHTLAAHLEALSAAGFTDVGTPWRLLSTVLLLARSPSDRR